MIVRVIDARHLGGHRVWLRFDDGLEGEVDLAGELSGEVFASLADPDLFASFSLDEAPTLTWPNGADFAPEFLHELASAAARRGAGSAGSGPREAGTAAG